MPTASSTAPHARPRPFPVRALVAALAVALALASGLPMSAAQAGGPGHQPRPTVVLVHGAWADSSSWSEVVRRLQGDGYPVEVPPNPLRGLASDAAYLAAYLQTIDGPIVLVGHSYGGAVITNAAAGNGNVKALVFVNAFIPDQGETVVQLASAQPGSALAVADPTAVFRLVPYPGSPPGDFDAYILPTVFVDAFAGDLPSRSAAVLAATQRPVTLSALTTPSAAAAWRSIPSWALVGTRDRVLPPAEQLAMAERARAHIVRADASHLSMVSKPRVVADLVGRAARATQ
jgi:pimeloyl-ACP methyl ester carboxylesterase